MLVTYILETLWQKSILQCKKEVISLRIVRYLLTFLIWIKISLKAFIRLMKSCRLVLARRTLLKSLSSQSKIGCSTRNICRKEISRIHLPSSRILQGTHSVSCMIRGPRWERQQGPLLTIKHKKWMSNWKPRSSTCKSKISWCLICLVRPRLSRMLSSRARSECQMRIARLFAVSSLTIWKPLYSSKWPKNTSQRKIQSTKTEKLGNASYKLIKRMILM